MKDTREIPKGTEFNLKTWDQPTPYAKALHADRIAVQEAEQAIERVEMVNNGDCTASVNGDEVLDTVGVKAMWIDRRKLCNEICRAFNEHAALCTVAATAAQLLCQLNRFLTADGTDQCQQHCDTDTLQARTDFLVAWSALVALQNKEAA